ncbi:MAG TPA: GspE/PulE family protein [Candidatus Kapabacteria bacterium]|nr:GspE/PulE family protein [Candidatus Kapabacteria bacterium]
MSNFGSIDDLIKKPGGTPAPASTPKKRVSPASATVDASLDKKMEQIGLKEKEMETMRYASSLGYPHIDLEKFPVSQNALRQIPEDDARRFGTVCFYSTQEEFRLGALDPSREDVQVLFTQIEAQTHAHGALYVISEKSFNRVMGLYATLPLVKPITKDIEVHADDLERVQADVNDFRSLQSLVEKTSTTDLLTFLLGAGLKLEASDVHVEAEESGIVVRVRIDGILHDAASLPKDVYQKLVSRIKLVSALKINITDAPQDGRFTIKLSDGVVDVRVSTIPTVYGESIVMRLLRQNRGGLTLDELGFRDRTLSIMKREIERPNGMIITTGPTGSGKTTTMYAILQMLNKPGVKIITMEDPVEYKIEGINQSQIDYSKGYTFAKGLRSMLRQDPDIAMVGEIRDLETADIAIQAALTGHLILSTIHTNSASGAIPRFLSMGVKPFLLAPALNCVIGQRLVRRLCDACKQETTLPEDVQQRVHDVLEKLPASEKKEMKGSPMFYTAPGCDTCSGLGYRGRIGIHEVFVMTPEIEQLILSGQISEFDIERLAIESGMVTMVQDGVLKAMSGLTSVDEVFRVIE